MSNYDRDESQADIEYRISTARRDRENWEKMLAKLGGLMQGSGIQDRLFGEKLEELKTHVYARLYNLRER